MNILKDIFQTVCNMSWTATFVIVLIILIRQFLKHSYKSFSYYLWAVAGFRLICPVSFESIFSFYNLPIIQNVVVSGGTMAGQRVLNVKSSAKYVLENSPSIIAKEDMGQEVVVLTPSEPMWSLDKMEVLTLVWLVVCVAILIYQFSVYLKLKKKLEMAVLVEANIYECDTIKEPFVLGVFRPKIYLPFRMKDDERRYILAHERYHIRRHDHHVKLLAVLILAVHWFNPMVWAACFLMCKDMEMSCDEKVLTELGNEIKQEYSTSLLNFAVEKRPLALGTLAFGETSVGARIKNILQFKKPKKSILIGSFIVCIIVVLGGIANGKQINEIKNITGKYATTEKYKYRLSDDVQSVVVYSEYYRNGKLENYDILFSKAIGGKSWGREGTIEVTSNCQYDDSGFLYLDGSITVNGENTKVSFPMQTYGYKELQTTFYQAGGIWQNFETDEDLVLAIFQLGNGSKEILSISSESFQNRDGKYAMLTQNPDVILYRMIFSAKSVDELRTEYQVPTNVKELYAAKNPYIGNHIADGKVLQIVMPGTKSYQTELHTSEEPYGITVHFETDRSDYNDEEFRKEMIKSAALFLMVTENANFFEWTYLTDDNVTVKTEHYTVQDIEKRFEVSDLKSYAQSEKRILEFIQLMENSGW